MPDERTLNFSAQVEDFSAQVEDNGPVTDEETGALRDESSNNDKGIAVRSVDEVKENEIIEAVTDELVHKISTGATREELVELVRSEVEKRVNEVIIKESNLLQLLDKKYIECEQKLDDKYTECEHKLDGKMTEIATQFAEAKREQLERQEREEKELNVFLKLSREITTKLVAAEGQFYIRQTTKVCQCAVEQTETVFKLLLSRVESLTNENQCLTNENRQLHAEMQQMMIAQANINRESEAQMRSAYQAVVGRLKLKSES